MSLALYRKYRPGRFADVVGQEHVTEPLARALANGRAHHAYLFSGPRGCGKTSTARILARSLNCERGPTAEPCGECRSCLDLAPNGPGSIDVVELDAATHGLVDDARELREKAHFAPVASRYKIYIIDEAHQLGPGAANALLKIIEEPPPHLMFIFATTAPDKILGTIRSRTHHYPFRLIPTGVLVRNLAGICEREGVPIEPAALALAARAGAGSARDAQSVLGQLIAGADEGGVTYELAHRLLGFTDVTLLDELVEAIAASDGATVFSAIDKVMDSGHDPRRFLTDLLERFRDLIVLSAVPNAVDQGLLEEPDDHVERLAGQAARFGPSDLVRLAEVIDAGITAMKGATPTRLQLEMVCARLLLPGADDSASGLAARLDRIERRIFLGGGVAAGGAPAGGGSASVGGGMKSVHDASGVTGGGEASGGAGLDRGAVAGRPNPGAMDPGANGADAVNRYPEPQPSASRSAAPGPVPARKAGSGPDIADVRRLWPEVLERLREIKRTPWSLISQDAVVFALDGGILTLAFRQPNLRDTFQRRDDFQTYLRQSIQDVLGLDLKIESIVDPSADPGASRQSTGSGRTTSRPHQRSPEPAGWDAGEEAAGGPAPDRPARPAGTPVQSPAADGEDPPDSGPSPPGPGTHPPGPGTHPPGPGTHSPASNDPARPSEPGVPRKRARSRPGSVSDAARAARASNAPSTAGQASGTADPDPSGSGPSGPGPSGSGPSSPGPSSPGSSGSGPSGPGPSGSGPSSPGTSDQPAGGPVSSGPGPSGPGVSSLGARSPDPSEPDPSDPDLDESGLSHQQLLERTLGAQVIQEIEHR